MVDILLSDIFTLVFLRRHIDWSCRSERIQHERSFGEYKSRSARRLPDITQQGRQTRAYFAAFRDDPDYERSFAPVLARCTEKYHFIIASFPIISYMF